MRRPPSDFNTRLAYTPDANTARLFRSRPPTAVEVTARQAPTPCQTNGNDPVTEDGAAEVPWRFVALLPIGVALEVLDLPTPRFNNWFLCHLNVIPQEDEYAEAATKNDLLGHHRDLDLKCTEVSALVARAAATVFIDWNLTGHGLSALIGGMSDMPVQLYEWAHLM